jgi:hypothetical protein
MQIPSSVEMIGFFCFEYCDFDGFGFSLTSELREIKQYTFFRSTIEVIQIPTVVRTIGESAFHFDARLIEIGLIKHVASLTIEGHVFEQTSVKSLTLPKYTEHICSSSLIGIADVSVKPGRLGLKIVGDPLIGTQSRHIVRSFVSFPFLVLDRCIPVISSWSFVYFLQIHHLK